MVVVDTNILLYAADRHSEFHAPCREWLDRQRTLPDAWYTTWPIIYEFLRITTHPRALRRPWKTPAAWEFIMGLFAAHSFSVLLATERHADVAGQVLQELPHLSGNILHDAHTAILMREHGVRRICSRDTDFHRFPFLEVIDPVRL